MVGVLPIGHVQKQRGQYAAIFWSLTKDGFNKWKNSSLNDWKSEAQHLWPGFAPFAAQIAHHEDMTFALYTRGTLKAPYDMSVAHIGDTAHRASPQLGQGANMALLDAYALAEAVKEFPFHQAAGVWANRRRIHTMIYQTASWALTPLYQSDSKLLPWVRNNILARPSQSKLATRILARLVCGDLVRPIRHSNLKVR
ncbi:MAG: FAD-dependent monooxygenase [Pseudomonadota bacterium]